MNLGRINRDRRGGISRATVLAVTGLAVTGLALSGCGAAKKVNAVRNLANGTTAKQVEDFQKRAEAASKLTYTAEYDSKATDGKVEKIRVVQKPPKSRYEQGDSIVINNGSTTIVCSPDGSSGKTVCFDSGAGGGGSVAGFTQAFNAPTLLAGLSTFAILPGVSANKSTKSLAGENLDCVKISVSKDNKHIESCVTSDGVLGFWDAGDGSTFTLTSFKRSASDSDFTPPSKPTTSQDLIDQANKAASQATSTSISIPKITVPSVPDTSGGSDSSPSSDTTDTTGG